MTTVNTPTTPKAGNPGILPTSPTGRKAHTIELSLTASYALGKQVPDLADRGCTISTAYGDITIQPGRLASRLAELLHREISRGGLQ